MMNKKTFLFWIVLNFSVVIAQSGWPDFRGPSANGHVSFPDDGKPADLPLRWSETENVKWKTAIPHRGWSTPVILGNQIWLTTATLEGHDFFAICLDKESGEILYNEKLFHSDNPEPLGNPLNCYASPSPVIENRRVYVHFGSYGTACLDTGNFDVIWKRTDLPCRHYRGPGSSPIIFKEFLILSMDGVDVQYITALNKMTGETIWKTDRTVDFNDLGPDGKPLAEGDFRKAYCTPIIVEEGGKLQMISAGAKAVYGYDPFTGREIWKIRYPAYSAAARPVFGNGLAFIPTGFDPSGLLAVRIDGEGDVTDSHIAWEAQKGAPQMPSPILVDDLLFWVNDGGIAYCLEAATGKQLWQNRIGGNYSSSPIYANGRFYCFDRDGKGTVLKAGKKFEILATNELDSGLMASPAVSGNALFLRTKTHLYRIETEGKRE